jgi:hypothetical protein
MKVLLFADETKRGYAGIVLERSGTMVTCTMVGLVFVNYLIHGVSSITNFFNQTIVHRISNISAGGCR